MLNLSFYKRAAYLAELEQHNVNQPVQACLSPPATAQAGHGLHVVHPPAQEVLRQHDACIVPPPVQINMSCTQFTPLLGGDLLLA